MMKNGQNTHNSLNLEYSSACKKMILKPQLEIEKRPTRWKIRFHSNYLKLKLLLEYYLPYYFSQGPIPTCETQESSS
jgi:hypothetical protein